MVLMHKIFTKLFTDCITQECVCIFILVNYLKIWQVEYLNEKKKVLIKVSKSQKQLMVSSILPKNERKKFDFTSMIPQVELFSFVFGRIEETINCFRDLLTFSCWTKFGNSDHCAFVNMFGFLVKNRSASNLLQCLTKAIVFELFYH